MIPLIPNHAYRLSGMQPTMWAAPHVVYGTPQDVAGIYLGCLAGTRTWHLFEVRIKGKDAGVIMMTTSDLEKITIREL